MDKPTILLDFPTGKRSQGEAVSAAPTFFLYGEPAQAAAEGFLHLEALDARTRPANWRIRAHRHDDLHHVFMLCDGAGEMWVEDERFDFTAPALLLIPAGRTHALRFVRETTGRVLTLSYAMMVQCEAREPEIAGLFASAGSLPIGSDAEEVRQTLDRLGRELAWRAPGHTAAVNASLNQVLIAALRLKCADAPAAGGEASDQRLVARLREQVEARFRRNEPIEVYASSLGVSLTRLRAACRATAAGSPLELVQARLMLEAKRALLYSHMNVGEIAASLGFEDPAYFNRLFRRRVGLPPRRFRERRDRDAMV